MKNFLCRKDRSDEETKNSGVSVDRSDTETKNNASRRKIRRYRRASRQIAIPIPDGLKHLVPQDADHTTDLETSQGDLSTDSESGCDDVNKTDYSYQLQAPTQTTVGDLQVDARDQNSSNAGSANDLILGSGIKEESCTRTRAASARDLVRSQERLVNMLQAMKIDISRMDREASRIKEDVVRSNQLFDIVVKMKEVHHLPIAREGYNIFYSMPRVTYPRQSYMEKPSSLRFLNQLSSFGSGSHSRPSSRRPSMSPDYIAACNVRALNRRSIQASLSCLSSGSRRRRSSQTSSTYDNNSGTESDIESTATLSYSWSRRHRPSISYESDSTYEGTGSSTESAFTYRQDSTVGPARGQKHRRPSYTSKVSTPEVFSDEIEI